MKPDGRNRTAWNLSTDAIPTLSNLGRIICMSQTVCMPGGRSNGRRGRVGVGAAFAVLAVLLAACGSNDASSSASSAAVATTEPATTVAPTTASPTTTEIDPSTTDVDGASSATTDASADTMADHSMADHTMAGDSMDHDAADDVAMAAMVWPRPWDPTQPIDFSGVPGVSAEQQTFAEDLVAKTLDDLPQFADTTKLNDMGFFSIGDEGTGHEHYINASYLEDDRMLDPNYPESVVFEVDGDQRKLVSAMFMVTDMTVDDPKLEAIGGPLMQWHVHNDLCWELTTDGPKVAGVHGPGESCPEGQLPFGAEFPMVHVWIAPHECGPFASLEGIGAGQVSADAEVRMDQCHQDHSSG